MPPTSPSKLPNNATPQDVAEAARMELARRYVEHFVGYTFPSYLFAPHNRLICAYLDRWIAGEIDRLMIFTPPRYGKSELVSRRLPAYILGREPESQIILSSYAAQLAQSMSRATKAIMRSEEYTKVFPEVHLSLKPGDILDTVDDWATSKGGEYRCAGVGGGITGRGFTHGIIDDPFKDRADAESEAIRNGVWDWYTSTFYTRQAPGAKILITMTRWHQDDTAGRLEEAQRLDELSDKWTILSLPALAEQNDPLGRQPGEPLWPERFSEASLKKTKRVLGTYDFEALYQQRPQPAGGSKIKPEWFHVVDIAPHGLRWVRYWDLAVSKKSDADYTVSIACAIDRRSGNIYLRDMIRGRWTWPEARRVITSTAISEKIPVAIEEAGQQIGFIDDLRTSINMASVTVYAIRSDTDKLTRALPWISRAEAGQVYLVAGSWVGEFFSECQSFTGHGDAHDDQVDAVSGAYRALTERLGTGPKIRTSLVREHSKKIREGY